MADYPLRSATDRRLGEPLPHQLTNQTQVHPIPINLWQFCHVTVLHYQVLIQVSLGYPCVWGRLPTRYSPVRRFPSLHSTEVLLRDFTLDLHVLGTPPAFILSQDQTLILWYLIEHLCPFKTSLSFMLVLKRNCVCICFFEIIIFILCLFFKELYVNLQTCV